MAIIAYTFGDWSMCYTHMNIFTNVGGLLVPKTQKVAPKLDFFS